MSPRKFFPDQSKVFPNVVFIPPPREDLSRGVLPENLRRGPYAVVEQADRAKPLFELLQRHFYLIFRTFVRGFTTAPLLPHFLDPSMRNYYFATFTSFLRP